MRDANFIISVFSLYVVAVCLFTVVCVCVVAFTMLCYCCVVYLADVVEIMSCMYIIMELENKFQNGMKSNEKTAFSYLPEFSWTIEFVCIESRDSQNIRYNFFVGSYI